MFLARFDGAGTLLWGVQFGATGDDWVYAGATDGAGGVFLAGETGGSFAGPHAGGKDAWFGRWDAAGTRLWARQIGTSGSDSAGALAPDGEGGIFVRVGAGYHWLARFDAAGTEVWQRPFESGGIVELAADGAGGFFGAGATANSFGGPYMGAGDAWVGRFDADGNLLWVRQLGTSTPDWAQGVSEDGQGGVFVAGFTLGPLVGPYLGEYDGWIARYDGMGNQLAVRQFGTPLAEGAGPVARDGLGGAFIAGNTNGSWGGASAGAADVWVAHLDGALNITWVDQFGSSTHDQSAAIAYVGPGSVFACGFTFGDLPGTGGGGGFDDAWLARYDLCYPDCNADGVLTVADFGCFQTRFMTADLYADCNADGLLTVSDFGCFQTKFVVGCP